MRFAQDDIDAGSIISDATLKGWSPSPGSKIMITEASDTTYLPWHASIIVEIVVVTVTTAGGINPTYSDSGDTATFDITITNTGNTRLSQVRLTDGIFGTSITCDHDISARMSEFLPALHHPIVCQTTVMLTTADIDTGSISITAKVRGYKQTSPNAVYTPPRVRLCIG